MNINDKFFSFPPFISTSWIHVSALTINKQGCILICMNSGETIALPELPREHMELIFKAHASFLENIVMNDPFFRSKRLPKERFETSELRFAFDGLGTNMQHNPAQKNAPDLPEEMLLKIAEVSKIMAPTDPDHIPKPEPHCNCPHCQIARAITGNLALEEDEEEEILIEELSFEQWEITQTGDKLFNVSNKLDQLESYSVHLGHPVGCTCGKENCEHILAVLKS